MGEAQHAAILRWLAVAGHDEVTVSCVESPVAGALVLDCCLAEVPLAWLAELAEHARVRAAVDACRRGDVALARLRGLTALTPRITLDGGPTVGPQVRYSAPPARRRGLLGLGTAAPGPSGSHAERLATALAKLPIAEGQPSPAARLIVSDACTACGVCVRSCPHDALGLTIVDGVATLTHRLPSCEGEEACVTWCPEDAISRDGNHPWAEVHAGPDVELKALPVRSCPRCHTRFARADEEPLCPVCRVREADEFGVHLPPAAQALLEQRRRRR